MPLFFGQHYASRGGDAAMARRYAMMRQIAAQHEIPEPDQGGGGIMGGLSTAIDLISRPLYGIVGGLDVLLGSGEEGETVGSRVAREVFSGIAGLQGQKETFRDLLEKQDIPEGARLSDAIGETFLSEKWGFDPTVRGTAALGMDILLDPVTWFTFGAGGALRVISQGGRVALSAKGVKLLTAVTDRRMTKLAKAVGLSDEWASAVRAGGKVKGKVALEIDARVTEHALGRRQVARLFQGHEESILRRVERGARREVGAILGGSRKLGDDMARALKIDDVQQLIRPRGINLQSPFGGPSKLLVRLDRGGRVGKFVGETLRGDQLTKQFTDLMLRHDATKEFLKGFRSFRRGVDKLFNRDALMARRLGDYTDDKTAMFGRIRHDERALFAEMGNLFKAIKRNDHKFFEMTTRAMDDPAKYMDQWNVMAKQRLGDVLGDEGAADQYIKHIRELFTRAFRVDKTIGRVTGEEVVENQIPHVIKNWGDLLPEQKERAAKIFTDMFPDRTQMTRPDIAGFVEERRFDTIDDLTAWWKRVQREVPGIPDLDLELDIRVLLARRLESTIRASNLDQFLKKVRYKWAKSKGLAAEEIMKGVLPGLIKSISRKAPKSRRRGGPGAFTVDELDLLDDLMRDIGRADVFDIRGLPPGAGHLPGVSSDPGVLTRLVRELPDARRVGGTLGEHSAKARAVALKLAETTTSPGHKAILRRIAPFIDEDDAFVLYDTRQGKIPGVPEKAHESLSTGAAGTFVPVAEPMTNRGIYIKTASDANGYDGLAEEVFVHELVHAATVDALFRARHKRFGGVGRGIDDAAGRRVIQATDELDDIRKRVLEVFPKHAGKDPALSNVEEFVSWALTNSSVQSMLKKVPSAGGESLWTRFINAVARMLGMNPAEKTALDDVIRKVDDLLDAEAAAVFDVSGPPSQMRGRIERSVFERAGKVPGPKTARRKEALRHARPEVQAYFMKHVLANVRSIKQFEDVLDEYGEIFLKIDSKALAEAQEAITGTWLHPELDVPLFGQQIRKLKIELPNNKREDWWVPEGVFDDLSSGWKREWLQQKEIRGVLRVWDLANNAFKASVTVPFPAFHFRNWYSNIAQMMLHVQLEAWNPVRHLQAIRIMSGMDGTLHSATGLPYTYSQIRNIAKAGGIEIDARRLSELIETRTPAQKIAGGVGEHPVLGKLAAPGRWPFQVGRKGAELIENEARYMMLISGLRRGMTPADAIAQANKVLFDYSSLSDFERNFMRRIIPFYTWTSKNLRLQIQSLATRPGLVAALQKPFNERGPHEDLLPEYIRGDLKVRLEPGKGKAAAFLTGIDLPANDLDRLFPKQVDKFFANQLSALNPAIKSAVELALNREAFSGRDIHGSQFVHKLGPLIDQASKWVPGLGEYFELRKFRTRRGEIRYAANGTKVYLWMKSWAMSRALGSTSEWIRFIQDDEVALGWFRFATGMTFREFDLNKSQRELFISRYRKLEDHLIEKGLYGSFEVPVRRRLVGAGE